MPGLFSLSHQPGTLSFVVPEGALLVYPRGTVDAHFAPFSKSDEYFNYTSTPTVFALACSFRLAVTRLPSDRSYPADPFISAVSCRPTFLYPREHGRHTYYAIRLSSMISHLRLPRPATFSHLNIPQCFDHVLTSFHKLLSPQVMFLTDIYYRKSSLPPADGLMAQISS